MKKYISIFIVAALIFTMFAGIGGTAYAAGEATVTLDPSTVTANAGDTVTITATVHNGSGVDFTDCKVKVGSTVFDGGPLVNDGTIPITVSFVVSESMLNTNLQILPQYKGASDIEFKNGDPATLRINKKELSVNISCTPTVSQKLVAPDDVIDFSFKIENQGEAKLENIVVKAPTLNGGKALNANKFSLDSKKSFTVKYSHTVTKAITVEPVVEYTVSGSSTVQKLTDIKKITLTEEIRQVDVYLTASTTTPNPGDEVTFTLRIENNGNVPYTELAVSWNGQEMDFPTTKLNPKDDPEKEYTIPFDTSQEVYFTITLKDHKKVIKQVNTNTISIQMPVDPGSISGNIGLVIEPDREALTAAGIVTFTGYVSNDSGYKLSEIKVTEATLGEIFSVSEMETGTKQSINKTVDVNETTTYSFILTVKDRNGQIYTVNADPITVTIEAVAEPSPTATEKAVDVTLPPTSGASNPVGLWIVIAVVLIVLIAGVGVTLMVLYKRGKTPMRSSSSRNSVRPSSSRPSPSRPSPSRPKTSLTSKFSKNKNRGYRDRNNF